MTQNINTLLHYEGDKCEMIINLNNVTEISYDYSRDLTTVKYVDGGYHTCGGRTLFNAIHCYNFPNLRG